MSKYSVSSKIRLCFYLFFFEKHLGLCLEDGFYFRLLNMSYKVKYKIFVCIKQLKTVVFLPEVGSTLVLFLCRYQQYFFKMYSTSTTAQF